jgi:hypothetical protein
LAAAAASRAARTLARSFLMERPWEMEKSSLLQRRWARTVLSGVAFPPSLFEIGKYLWVGSQSLQERVGRRSK